MARKNSPGCNCCFPCACETGETLPEIEIYGFTGGGWQGWTGDCCNSQVFTPNAPIVTKSCSDVIDTYTKELTCHVDYWAGSVLNKPVPEPPNCFEVINNCCAYCPAWGWEFHGSSDSTITHVTRTRLYTSYQLNALIVRLMRRTVLCNNTPVCKYILMLDYAYNWFAKWYAEQTSTLEQTTTPNNPCFVTNPAGNFDGTCTIDYLLDCSYDPPAGGFGLCQNGGNICFSRVKFFDSMPEGNISFGSSDIPGVCDFDFSVLYCTDTCLSDEEIGYPNWASQVCIETDVLCEPEWCETPPTIVENSTTYQFGWQCTCQTANVGGCCDPFLTMCTQDPVVCETSGPAFKTVKCFEIECPFDPPYTTECDCAWLQSEPKRPIWGQFGCDLGWYSPAASDAGCESAINSICCCATTIPDTCSVPGVWPFVLAFDCSGSPPCASNDCCYVICPGEDCASCANTPQLGGTGAGIVRAKDASASISITCDNGIPDDLCISPPGITMTLSFEP